MSYKFEEGKDLIINAVIERINLKMTEPQAKCLTVFASQFYRTMALEDLKEWTIDDLYGAVVNFWSLIQVRAPQETRIKIYNPDFEKHGWQTTHTVVEVNCDDAPFLVDSLRLAIHRRGLASHLIIHTGGLKFKRDEKNNVIDIDTAKSASKTTTLSDAAIYIEIDRQSDQTELESLKAIFERVLEDNHIVCEDWTKMRNQVQEAIKELDDIPLNVDTDELAETKAFLHWLEDHHFTFLGVRDYELIQKGEDRIIQAIPKTGLGILRNNISKTNVKSLSAMAPEARELSVSSRILVMSKTHYLATVHRDAYCDYIGIKRFDKQGKVIGERRIIGLYTSAAYNTNPKHIPFLRRKVALVMEKSGFNPRSHGGKTLLNILETLPRDDLIQANEDELLELTMGIFYLQDRRRIRLFARKDVYARFISCLVYVPKDLVNSDLANAMQEVLAENFNAREITCATWFSDTMLARIHFIVYVDPLKAQTLELDKLEQKLVRVARSWSDELHYHLIETFGEERSVGLYSRYKQAFPLAYMDNISPKTAVYDIKHIEMFTKTEPLGINFYRLMDEPADHYRLKIYQKNSNIALSDVLPILENLGLRAITERPYCLKLNEDEGAWISDFAVEYIGGGEFDLDVIRDSFQEAIIALWNGDADNDGFNQLILGASFTWREVVVLRAYAKYFKQIAFIFSQVYIEQALNNNALIAKKLANLFQIRFDPRENLLRDAGAQNLIAEILNDLDEVSNLDEDKIIRQYVEAINATLRTNFYQQDAQGKYKNYLSLKLNSSMIPGVPKPHPMFEIFVYSPRFEGVHLRCSRVARGGLRWSDRREDFRTEILGLVKAQQVKNAIIVPNGAKGGFVPKWMPLKGTREEIQAEGIACYQLFIRSLLDITDNYKNESLVKPQNVVCYDADDPYLVVAADKGTATFSDIANAISLEYGFWLGDAFASGGSIGYDHKKMGITAKGAWESVKRHFYELNMDIQHTDFTVAGIGDMSGDVFGNGMLLSRHIKLVGAFNHLHIFVDPDPSPEVSFNERLRLFNLPRSSWSDYDSKLISKGGGVFNRSAKSIPVSKEMKARFNIETAAIEPNDLIRAILSAKVDLLWSGGIGTYVKADSETNAEVGDKTNDATRINASKLRCRVIGEGGNLGLTQLARIEYSLNGGLDCPDFIDNSGGVNCSDKEVNIKILLNAIVDAGDLTHKQRNDLLAEMTPEVSALVLRDNFMQTRAISLIASQASHMLGLHMRYIDDLEQKGLLDRALEFIPDNKTLMERKLAGKGLTRPALSVLMCYSKIILKEQILATDIPEDPWSKNLLVSYFPHPLQARFSAAMQNHPLKREIIATKISNIIVNEMSFTFVYRLQDETGASVASIVRAYLITRSVLNLEAIGKQIEDLGTKIASEKQLEILMIYLRLSRRITRWFLRAQRTGLDVTKAIHLYSPGLAEFKSALPEILSEKSRLQFDDYCKSLVLEGMPETLAHELAVTKACFSAMDIVDVAHQTHMSIREVAQVYFGVGEFLDLAWIRTQIIMHPSDNHWEALSREALRDDLDWQQRQLAVGVLAAKAKKKDIAEIVELWSERHQELIMRWQHILEALRTATVLNYTMFFVAIRELLDLTQATLQVSEKLP